MNINTDLFIGIFMPFGKYKDFDACVSANKDKSDPEAY